MSDGKKYDIFKTNDGYGNVRVAIVKQAIDDYKNALRYNDKGKCRALESFFLSEWGEMLSGGNGAYIIEKVKSEERKIKYD